MGMPADDLAKLQVEHPIEFEKVMMVRLDPISSGRRALAICFHRGARALGCWWVHPIEFEKVMMVRSLLRA